MPAGFFGKTGFGTLFFLPLRTPLDRGHRRGYCSISGPGSCLHGSAGGQPRHCYCGWGAAESVSAGVRCQSTGRACAVPRKSRRSDDRAPYRRHWAAQLVAGGLSITVVARSQKGSHTHQQDWVVPNPFHSPPLPSTQYGCPPRETNRPITMQPGYGYSNQMDYQTSDFRLLWTITLNPPPQPLMLGFAQPPPPPCDI